MQWLPSSFLVCMLVLCGKAEYWKKAPCFRFCFLDFVNSVYELTDHRSVNWFRVSILYICINEFSHSNLWSPDHRFSEIQIFVRTNWSKTTGLCTETRVQEICMLNVSEWSEQDSDFLGGRSCHPAIVPSTKIYEAKKRSRQLLNYYTS